MDCVCPVVSPDTAALVGGVVLSSRLTAPCLAAVRRFTTCSCMHAVSVYNEAVICCDFTDPGILRDGKCRPFERCSWSEAYPTVSEAMKPTEAMTAKYATVIGDQWDYRSDVSRSHANSWTMRPVVNSHCARQLNMWAIPAPRSGQQFVACDSSGAALSCDRREPATWRRAGLRSLRTLRLDVQALCLEGEPCGHRRDVISGRACSYALLWHDCAE